MKVNVRLFGAIGMNFPGYKPATGLEVDIREGATVNELLFEVNILKYTDLAVIRDGRILKADEQIHPDDRLCLLQVVYGG